MPKKEIVNISRSNHQLPGVELPQEEIIANYDQVLSQEIPAGVDRRTFLMRSAVIGAAVVITGNPITAQEVARRSTPKKNDRPARTEAPPNTDSKLHVVMKTKGPVMTTIDEFYKVGPGPSSSHTIGPMRITYEN